MGVVVQFPGQPNQEWSRFKAEVLTLLESRGADIRPVLQVIDNLEPLFNIFCEPFAFDIVGPVPLPACCSDILEQVQNRGHKALIARHNKIFWERLAREVEAYAARQT